MTRYSARVVMGLALLLAGGVSASCDKKKGEKESPAAAAESGDKGAATTEAAGDNPTLAEMRTAKDEFCACPDLACTEGVMKKFAHLDEAGTKLSKDDQKKAMVIALEIAKCVERIGSKFRSGDSGVLEDPAPDAPADTKAEQATLAEMAKVQTEVCKCKDTGCAQAVMDEHKKLDNSAETLSPAGQDRAMKIAMDIASCMAKMEHGPE